MKFITLPNSLSSLAFFCAFSGIYLLLILENFIFSFILILIGFIFDILDGFFARKLNQISAFGTQLDAHIDVFLYLIYPILVFYNYFEFQANYWIFLYFIFLILGIFRLIRNNLKNSAKHFDYQGLPVVFSLFLIILAEILEKYLELKTLEIIIFSTLLIGSGLMISTFKFPKPKKISLIILFILILIGLLTHINL